MTGLLLGLVLTVHAPYRLDLEPPRVLAMTIDPDAAERVQVNPWLAAPAVILLGLPLSIDFIVGEAWLLGGGPLGRWDLVGYGALSVIPIFGPWILYLINGPTPFGELYGWIDPARGVRRGVLIDAMAQTVGAALMVASFLIPGPREPGPPGGTRERDYWGLRVGPTGLTWVF